MFKRTVQCHITRAIENQIDYAHLGIVHRRSIGRGFDPRLDVEFRFTESSLEFRMGRSDDPSRILYRAPNVWLNGITSRFMIAMAFAPIDDSTTQLYAITYQNYVTTPGIHHLLGMALNTLNRHILSEDVRVVDTHPPGSSLHTGSREKLIGSDRVIRQFREIWGAPTERR